MATSYTILTGDKDVSGSIKSWMNYSKLDADGILDEAQTMIYSRLRVREMKASERITVRVGIDAVDLPDDFLDPITSRDITNDMPIDYKDDEDALGRTWTDGVLDSGDPTCFAIFDEMLNFDAKTTTQWYLRMTFYQQPPALAASNPTNFLTRRYPHLLRMACLATGARFNDDEPRYAREQQLLFKEIEELAANDEMGRASDVPVRE